MADAPLSDAGEAQLLEVARSLQRRRLRAVAEVVSEFKEAKEYRLTEELYTHEDAERLLDGLLGLVRTSVKNDVRASESAASSWPASACAACNCASMVSASAAPAAAAAPALAASSLAMDSSVCRRGNAASSSATLIVAAEVSSWRACASAASASTCAPSAVFSFSALTCSGRCGA